MSALPRMAIVVVLLISGCGLTGGAPPSDGSSGGTPSSTGGSDPAISRVACDDVAFDLALLDEPGGAENGDDPAAVALREHLASGMETDFLPAAGWIEAVRTESRVLFVAPVEGGLARVDMKLEGGQWHASGDLHGSGATGRSQLPEQPGDAVPPGPPGAAGRPRAP